MSTIHDLQGELAEVSSKMKAMFDAAGPDIDMTAEQVVEVRALKAQEDKVGKELDAKRELEAMRTHTATLGVVDKTGRALAAGADRADDVKAEVEDHRTFGEMFVESAAYTGKQPGANAGPVATLSMPRNPGRMMATLMTTTAGWVPETLRTGRLVESAQRPIQVTDLIPAGRTSQNAVVYMVESTFTNAAAETAEGGTYAESALALTETSSAVRKIATFLPVTDEQLEDVAGIESYINNRLGFMLRQRLDSQILVGNGTPPNLQGFATLGSIQTQAKGADPTPDAIYKAMTLIRVTGRANPSGIVMNPTDWQDVKLLRTADGIYIWGSPADNNPDRIWGVQVALSDAQTLNTALVGDFQQFSELVMRRDVEVQISNSHSTYFIEGKQAIRADLRVALVVYRPTAFCLVTGV